MYNGESRLAMALESGDVRVLAHETRSVGLGDVKRAKRRQKTRQIPRRFDLPQSDSPTASGQHRSSGRRSSKEAEKVKRSTKAFTGYRLDLQGG